MVDSTDSRPQVKDPAIVGAPPLVAGFPLVGLVPHLLRDPLATMTAATRRHGDAVRLQIGPKECYLFTHPDHAQHILLEHAKIYTKESSLWEAAQSLVGKGIGTTDGEFWLKHRRAMQPQFHRSRLADLSSIMAAAIRELLDKLHAQAVLGHRSISLFNEMRRMVSQVFLKTMFNMSFDDTVMKDLLQAVKESFASVDTILWTSFLPKWMPLPGKRRYRAALQSFDSIVRRIVNDRLNHPSDKDDLLNLLLQSFDTKKDDAQGMQELRDEIATMIVATQDGPSLMLGWGLTLLCQHPSAETTLRREIHETLGSRSATLEDMPALAYTKGVLEESLRLYVPLWLTVRLATEDDVIDGIRIPRGSFVFLCPYITHRNPKFWSAPESFDPTRFLKDDAMPAHRGAYLPFGLGPHLCIGKHVGLTFGQIFLAEFVQRFRLRLAPGTRVEPKGMVSLQPRHEIMAELEPL